MSADRVGKAGRAGKAALVPWVRSTLAARRGLRRITATSVPALMALGGAFPMIIHGTATRPAFSPPSRVLCSGWYRCPARGYASYDYAARGWRSYWRMSAGDECTNYAAFVESTVYQARQPAYLLGNGGQWAASAAAHGVLVNNRPSVGAVAEWDSDSFGMGGFGHVAVVEAVGPHGKYIVISQQHISTDMNGYDWTLIKAHYPSGEWQEWPSHFIHFRIPRRADVGYFNPRSDTVGLRFSQTAGPADFGAHLGLRGVVPLIGDWRGNGIDSTGYYNPKYGTFRLLGARRGRHPNVVFRFGPPGMVPLVGDWKGIGRDGVGYYNPRTSTFSLRESLTAGPPNETFTFGPRRMIPLAGDWAGGRRDGIGYYDPATGAFKLRIALSRGRANFSFWFGPRHMIPLVGNWGGGRRDGVGYYNKRTGTFYLRDRLSGGRPTTIVRFGRPGMVPLTGDWFGI
jgi:surface antigen